MRFIECVPDIGVFFSSRIGMPNMMGMPNMGMNFPTGGAAINPAVVSPLIFPFTEQMFTR